VSCDERHFDGAYMGSHVRLWVHGVISKAVCGLKETKRAESE
jgi:hypothetical protein